MPSLINQIFIDFVHGPMSSDGPTIMKKKNSISVYFFKYIFY